MSKRNRKKQRKTPKNASHVDKIWGSKGSAMIYIPTMIDDYNHWMGGVDLSDQRISYYHPDLRCLRNWVPMCIQILSMIRNNGFIVHNNDEKIDNHDTHKVFTLSMITKLMKNATNAYLKEQEMSTAYGTLSTITTPPASMINIPQDRGTGSQSSISNTSDLHSTRSRRPTLQSQSSSSNQN